MNISKANYIVDSLPEAQQISSQTQQPILVIFGSDSCVFCDKLKTDINNQTLIEYIDPYIVCYVDLNEYPQYKGEYKITIIPDSRILSNNKMVSKAQGYSKDKYIDWLKSLKK
jgi:thioredoxin-related protein